MNSPRPYGGLLDFIGPGIQPAVGNAGASSRTAQVIEILRFDELFSVHIIRPVLDPDLYEVQRLYPMIYLACHIDHVRSSSTKWRLSSHDSSVLAHLDTKEGMSPRSLATHLGVVPSTLSAAISRLTKLGYIESTPLATDRRRKALRLTALGAKAMASTSVLNSERVRAMLSLLTQDERQTAVEGLTLLAKAARQLAKTK